MLTWLLVAAAVVGCWLFFSKRLNNNTKLNLPPRPFTVPLLGSVGLLAPGKSENPNKALFDLSSSYGGIFRTQIGSKTSYIVTSYALFREAVVDKPTEFIGRPNQFNELTKINPHRLGIVAGTGSPAFMAFRKFVLVKLRSLGFGKRSMEFCILNECEVLLEEIYNISTSKSALSLRDVLCATTANVIFGVLCSKRYEYGNPTLTAITRAGTSYIKETTYGAYLLGFPLIARLTPFFARAKQHITRLQEYIDELIQERLASGLPASEEEARDFMDIYLMQWRKQQETGEEQDMLSVEMLAQTIEDLFLVSSLPKGGFETTATSVMWLLFVMLHFPDLKRRIQAEIDEHCKQYRSERDLITLADTDHLPLTVATIWEVWRMYPILPFGITHQCARNAKLGGYDIEKHMDINFHLWSIHHDPQYWCEPEKFYPERFMFTEDGDQANGAKLVLKHPDQLVVFSAGRRSCIGEQLARKETFLLFANIMRAFDVTLREGAVLAELKEKPGFVMYPPDFEAVLNRRQSQCSTVGN